MDKLKSRDWTWVGRPGEGREGQGGEGQGRGGKEAGKG